MPTLIGLVFLCCGAYCFLLEEDWLLGLLVIASAFQAASAINIAGRGVPPYYVVAVLIILRAIANRLLGLRFNRKLAGSGWLILFGAIAIASAFILPIVFAGTPIYDPKIGIDDGLFNRPPLKLGLNNFGQAGFLALQIGTAFATLGIRYSAAKTNKAFLMAFYIVTLVIFAQFIGQFAGVQLPDSLIRNNPGYSIADADTSTTGTRNSGTFAEPSAAGAFLLIFCIGFFSQYLRGRESFTKVILSFAVSALVASSGSIFASLLFGFILCLCYSPFRFPWYISIGQSKRILGILFVIVVPVIAVLLLSPQYRETMGYFTVAKGDTGSFINRTASDLYALDLLTSTRGLGVGLGSNRASSLITTLISNVGVVGLLAFGAFYFKLFRSLKKENVWLAWAGYALLLNMCLDVADVTIPIFWVPIMLAIQNCEESELSGMRLRATKRGMTPRIIGNSS